MHLGALCTIVSGRGVGGSDRRGPRCSDLPATDDSQVYVVGNCSSLVRERRRTLHRRPLHCPSCACVRMHEECKHQRIVSVSAASSDTCRAAMTLCREIYLREDSSRHSYCEPNEAGRRRLIFGCALPFPSASRHLDPALRSQRRPCPSRCWSSDAPRSMKSAAASIWRAPSTARRAPPPATRSGG